MGEDAVTAVELLRRRGRDYELLAAWHAEHFTRCRLAPPPEQRAPLIANPYGFLRSLSREHHRRPLESRHAKQLHVTRAGARAEIGDEIVLDDRRHERGQEDDVGHLTVDRRERVLHRVRDDDLVGDVSAKSVAQGISLVLVRLYYKEPGHKAQR